MNQHNTSWTVSGRMVGRGHPTLIIAEIGVNHDGSVERAIELVHAAKAAGADAIKLQVFRAEALMNAGSRFADYQKARCEDDSPIEMLRRYELSPTALRRITDAARKVGLLVIATPFSTPDLPSIESLNLDAIKIASPDLVNRPLLSAAGLLKLPMICSTGAATLQEVERTVAWLREDGVSFSLLHCISSYPVPPEHANLAWISELAARFDVPVGYSDHCEDLLCGALAVTAGAVLIEKHLTHDCEAAGPDHAASADPAQFAEYVRMIRAAEQFRGDSPKHVLDIEQDVRGVSRQSLVVCRDMAAGEVIHSQDLIIQRPGTGIPAAELSHVVGRRVAQPLWSGTMLQWHMLKAVHPAAA